MRVRLKLGPVRRLTRRAEREFARLGPDCARIAEEAADLEKATKTYQRRTGTLEDGTEATFTPEAGGWTIVLKQGAFYGVYVQALGYSEFEDWAVYAGVGIDNRIKAGERRLST